MGALLGNPGGHGGAIVELDQVGLEAAIGEVLAHAEVEDVRGAKTQWENHRQSVSRVAKAERL